MGKYAITQTVVPTRDILSLTEEEIARIEELAREVKLGDILDNLEELRSEAGEDAGKAIDHLKKLQD